VAFLGTDGYRLLNTYTRVALSSPQFRNASTRLRTQGQAGEKSIPINACLNITHPLSVLARCQFNTVNKKPPEPQKPFQPHRQRMLNPEILRHIDADASLVSET